MTNSGSAGGDGALGKRRARFNRWRRGRPFAGGALLILASFVIAWIPINIAPETIFLGEALSPVGLMFAALVFLCGIFALTRPQNADIFGIFGGMFSIFSLYGALGGFVIGTALGLIGANLCYAWIDEDEESDNGSGGTDTTRAESEESAFEFEDTDEDDSGGLFGTRSVGRTSTTRATGSSGSPAGAGGAGGRTASLVLLVFAVVVLGAFAHPFVTAAAQPFPEQTQIDGTIVVAEQFSGQSYNHQNVSIDTSNRESVPAARQSFSSAQIQGMTIYKNFRTGPQSPYSIVISGSSSSAPNGLSLTSSEFYASQLSLAGAVPLAQNKWSTCPGQDFLLSNGDIIRPPIEGQDVTTNTHQLSANTVTIQNLNLTVQRGAKSTSVTGTPECTRNPVEPVLDLFTANALNLLVEDGRLNRSVLTNGSISDFTAPAEVNQSEPFDVSATVSNTGYLNDTRTVEYRFDNETRRTQNVSLAPNETTSITFEDVTANTSEGTYEHGVFTENGSATGTISVVNETNVSSLNATENATNAAENESVSNRNNTTNGTAVNATSAGQNGTSGTDATANATDGNETTTASTNETSTTETATPTTAEATTTTETPTATPTETTTETQTTETSTPTETPTETASTQSSDSEPPTAETSGNVTTTTTETPTATSTTTEAPTETTAGNTTTNGSALIGFP